MGNVRALEGSHLLAVHQHPARVIQPQAFQADLRLQIEPGAG